MKKQFLSFETMFFSLKCELETFLKQNVIYYEISGCFGGWHFEVLCDDAIQQKVNDFLDSVTIYCEGVR